jgi:F-type H+-transporting ATPase subunit epsilon
MKGNNISIDEHVNERFQINQNEVTLAINSGTVEMKNNKVIVLAE